MILLAMPMVLVSLMESMMSRLIKAVFLSAPATILLLLPSIVLSNGGNLKDGLAIPMFLNSSYLQIAVVVTEDESKPGNIIFSTNCAIPTAYLSLFAIILLVLPSGIQSNIDFLARSVKIGVENLLPVMKLCSSIFGLLKLLPVLKSDLF